MTTTHTPGPWHVEPMAGDPDAIWIGNADGYTAQITREDGLAPADWSDARLIAAAPDLLAALQEMEAWAEQIDDDDSRVPIHVRRMARAAIARATGEA